MSATTAIVEQVGRPLTEFLMQTLRELASDWWGALDGAARERIEKAVARLCCFFIEWPFAGIERRRDIKLGMEASANTIRADIEAAGVIIRREGISIVQHMAINLILGMVKL